MGAFIVKVTVFPQSMIIMFVKVTVNTIVVKGNQDVTLDVKTVFKTDVI